MESKEALRRSRWFPLLLAALAPTAAALLYSYAARSPEQVQVLYFVTKVVIFAFPVCWYLFKENRSGAHAISAQPLAGARIRLSTDMALGSGTGCFIGVCIWASYWFVLRGVIDSEQLVEHSRRFGADRHYLTLAIFLAVVNSGLEEYYWRWFVFGRLRTLLHPAAAVVLSSLAFAAHHFIVLLNLLGDPVLAGGVTLGVVVGGAIWAAQYHLTGRLWGAWLSHFVVDSAILSVGYDCLFQNVR